MHKVMAMFGCAGEMPGKAFERFTNDFTSAPEGEEMGTMVSRVNPTCPCEEFRAIAEVDRPHRYFNQRRPADRTDPAKHPFAVGMRAYRTRIGKLKRAQIDGPTGVGARWADEEFVRRFRWLKSRVCGISVCTVTDDVWPVFVTSQAASRSELRCAKHR